MKCPHFRFILAAILSAFACTTNAAVLDSISLPAKDPTATAKWYASNFGGKRSGASVKFDNVTVTWTKAADGAATTNPAIAHLGFAVADTPEKLAALQKSKARVLRDVHAGPASQWAVVADPNGMPVGILDNIGTNGFHHVMLKSPLLGRRETLSWYQDVVGGEIQNLAGSPLWTGVHMNNIWILFEDELPSKDAKNYVNASMTWRTDNVEEAKAIQAKRADSEENIGEGLVVIDPCGLPVHFIEDAKAASNVPEQKVITSNEIVVTEEHFKRISEHKGDYSLEVVRILGQDDCTLGQVFMNGVCLGYVLELPWQGNKPMISSIPAGTYALSMHLDTKKRMRLHVEGVPGRSGIQLHIGTTPDDTQGCILVGTGVSSVNCTLTSTREAASRLRKAYWGTDDPKENKLDKPVTLTISDSVTSVSEAANAAEE